MRQPMRTTSGSVTSLRPTRCGLRWAAVLPLTDLEWAAAELEWAIGEGATTVMLSPIPTPAGQSLGSVDIDPLWHRLVEAGLPAVVHASNPASPTLGIIRHLTNRVQWQMGVPLQLQLAVLHIIDGGTLERFPELRVGFFEGDVGWLAHWLGRLDETYEKMALVGGDRRRSARAQFRRPVRDLRGARRRGAGSHGGDHRGRPRAVGQ